MCSIVYVMQIELTCLNDYTLFEISYFQCPGNQFYHLRCLNLGEVPEESPWLVKNFSH